MPSTPLVTVVVATYNCADTLDLTLRAVLGQTLQDFEVQVVGDACTDGSAEVVAALADDRLHWTNLTANSGSQAGPNNEAIRRASGRYIAYCGHDDLWLPWHLAELVPVAEQTGAAAVYSLCARIRPDGGAVASGPLRDSMGPRARHVPPTTVLHPRAVAEQAGPWRMPGELDRPVDVEFLGRLAGLGALHYHARLTALRFISRWYRAYDRTGPPAQRPYLEELQADPLALERRLLTLMVTETSRRECPLCATPAAAVRQLGRLLRTRTANVVERVAPGVIKATFQRERQRLRRQRGLAPDV